MRVKAAWVTGDTVYGGDYKLRSWLEERLQPYVLAIPKHQRIGLTHRADEVVASWEAPAWQRLSAGEGSQGPRFYDWAWQELSFRWTEPGWKQLLLARRSLSDPTKIAYYFVFAPESVTLDQVVRAAGSRWQVEEAIELAKQQVGLDEYEVRYCQGWYRHSSEYTLNISVVPNGMGVIFGRMDVLWNRFYSEEHTYHPGDGCPGVFDGGQSDRAKKGAFLQEQEVAQLLPLTVPEVRRLLWRLVWQALPAREEVLRWSRWRRRHQARAKQAHIKRRDARLAA
jgi:hypothetical protein